MQIHNIPNNEYLKREISKKVVQNSRSYWLHYNIIRIQRFFVQAIMIFAFQFLVIINLHFSYPQLPMYPPIGIAFTMFYMFGNAAFWGLFFAGLFAYLLKGLPSTTLFSYLTADIGVGCLAGYFCQRIFTSDIKPFSQRKEVIQFILFNAFVTCLVSAAVRLIPLVFHYPHSGIEPLYVFYNFIDLWLADLNAILILSSFILSWAFISFSRERISPGGFPILPLMVTIAFVALSLLQQEHFHYVMMFSMLALLILSLLYGYLIATALLFVFSTVYLTYFMQHLPQFLIQHGLPLYTFVPLCLLLFTLGILYVGHLKRVHSSTI